MVTVPRIIFKDAISIATITVSNLEEDATITISLKKKNKNHGRFSEVITSSPTNQVVKMDFAPFNDPEVGQIDFEIEAEGGLNFSHSTQLEVKAPKDRIFIQTDKPIYKPGEKSKFYLQIKD